MDPETQIQEYKFVYMEDDQMYSVTPVLMVQLSTPVSVEELQSWSWSAPLAGKFSTSAKKLVEIAASRGRTLKILKRSRYGSKLPKAWVELPLVKGATGNY